MIHPPFGAILKGFRLGFHWSGPHQCFIRLSPAGKLCRMELAPGNNGAKGIPNKSPSEEHICWWDDRKILDLIEPLKWIKAVHKPVTIYLDDAGKAVAGNISTQSHKLLGGNHGKTEDC